MLSDAKSLAEKRGVDRCTYSEVNVEESASLKPIIYIADIVISYVPAFLHLNVAKVCLELGKHLVTASYITKEMEALHQEAKKKGLIFLNQLGLDPGIDHLATMKIIHQVAQQGGKILQYQSWCGGLPSPSCCDNPLGYKFTWSPIGAFRALKNNAVYIDNSKQIEIKAKNLLYSGSKIELNQALSLEGYPNRDSVSYKSIYGLENATKVLRGTLRYPGFCEIINAFKEIGYFDQTPVRGQDWLQYTNALLQNQQGSSLSEKIRNRTVENVVQYQKVIKEEKQKKYERILSALKYFGFLSAANKFFDPKLNNLQNLIKLVEPKLALKAGQTDLIAMQHKFVIEIKGKKYLRKSSLIQIGEKKGFSAMAVTVGVPSAIGAQLILDGKISERGVLRPIYPDIYNPTLKLLEEVGIKLIEVEEELN